MNEIARTAVVVGGGSAGFLSALAFLRAMPGTSVRLVRSAKIPVIGVGESTTRAVPIFLHGALAIDRHEFYRQVRPIWKLGNRLEWGDPGDSHFNYPFDSYLLEKNPGLKKCHLYYCAADGMHDAGTFYSLMDLARSPFFRQPDGRVQVNESFGYHLDNRRFLEFLENEVVSAGGEIITGDVAQIKQDERGNVERIELEDGRSVSGDLFVDCSGFPSVLLKQVCGARYVDFSHNLFCDRAAIGSWNRTSSEAIKPYTATITMRHGWCWNIGFFDRITSGYVYSSQFCSDDEAIEELKQKHPRLGDDLRVISFPSGRYEEFWINNVVGIGNSAGFVEPLEATALQMITEQLRYVCKVLLDSNWSPPPLMKDVENRRYRMRWDDIHDFLAVHYKFNNRVDSPFWQHCRQNTDLGQASELVEYYQTVGASMLANHFAPDPSIFGFEGYLTMLIGQRVPTQQSSVPSDLDAWRSFRQTIRNQARQSLSMGDAQKLMFPSSA